MIRGIRYIGAGAVIAFVTAGCSPALLRVQPGSPKRVGVVADVPAEADLWKLAITGFGAVLMGAGVRWVDHRFPHLGK